MHIVVVRVGAIQNFPPALSLVNALLDLGHDVTLLVDDPENMPDVIAKQSKYESVGLLFKGGHHFKGESTVIAPRKIREYLKNNESSIDLVWLTTDVALRAAGKVVREFRYVVQLSELVESTPLLGGSYDLPIESKFVKYATRQANCVVVPEYNRAHIQRAYWDLKKTPVVLPNKPYPDPEIGKNNDARKAFVDAGLEGKKILMYQGVFYPDRDLSPYVKAVEKLGGDWRLVLLGKGLTPSAHDEVIRLCETSPSTHYLGFVPAPHHLEFTPFGRIGLLPYKAGKNTRFSPLNALYCAPNKIWEYSRFGLPMVGSDVPGLASEFNRNGIGVVANTPSEVVNAVERIDSEYEEYSKKSKQFFASVDFKKIVSDILVEASK